MISYKTLHSEAIRIDKLENISTRIIGRKSVAVFAHIDDIRGFNWSLDR